MQRDLISVAAIAAVALFVRLQPAWPAVFAGGDIRLLETDAWYHVRLIENQVRNYPWRVSRDPYAAPGGQFVPIAPLFDTLAATAIVVGHGRDATPAQVARAAAFVPPVLGMAAIVVAFLLARRLFDRRAGLVAAGLLAVLPGHFLDRTQLGFVDHHALEALLALATLYALLRACDPALAPRAARLSPIAAGVVLGLYLLSWASGGLLIAIVLAWLLLLIAIARSPGDVVRPARAVAAGALVALALVLTFQDPRMHRYGSQVVGLMSLASVGFALNLAVRRMSALPSRLVIVLVTAVAGAAAALALWWLAPAVANQLTTDLLRLSPDPTRMAVLEARPLFMYPGHWHWPQPWAFFRSGFYVGAIALTLFTIRVWRGRRAPDLLLWVFAAAMFAATFGQNRFGYYLMPACALLGGWLAAALFDWAGVPHAGDRSPVPHTRLPLAREMAVVAVAAGMFAPSLAPAALLAPRTSSLPDYWADAMTWLARRTPPPFPAPAGGDYYYARYPRDTAVPPAYTIMNWWDQGYWIVQRARRVPVANPTQERAPIAARFYLEADEARAASVLHDERARYVIADWELPFRMAAEGRIMGRFQNLVDWAGGEHARYYEVYYRRDGDRWTPVWIFHEPYYRSMAYRLTVLGGAGATPSRSSVITFAERTDDRGRAFRELVSESSHPTYDAAREAAAMAPDPAHTRVVGLDPWHTAFPLPPLTFLQHVYAARTPEQGAHEAPWVRILTLTEKEPASLH